MFLMEVYVSYASQIGWREPLPELAFIDGALSRLVIDLNPENNSEVDQELSNIFQDYKKHRDGENLRAILIKLEEIPDRMANSIAEFPVEERYLRAQIESIVALAGLRFLHAVYKENLKLAPNPFEICDGHLNVKARQRLDKGVVAFSLWMKGFFHMRDISSGEYLQEGQKENNYKWTREKPTVLSFSGKDRPSDQHCEMTIPGDVLYDGSKFSPMDIVHYLSMNILQDPNLCKDRISDGPGLVTIIEEDINMGMQMGIKEIAEAA